METQTPNIAAAFADFAIMAGVLVAASIAYAIAKLQTEVATITWVRTNRLRFILSFVLIGVLAGLIEFVPDIEPLFLALGLAVDKTPVGVGITIAGILIGVTSAPAKGPSDV